MYLHSCGSEAFSLRMSKECIILDVVSASSDRSWSSAVNCHANITKQLNEKQTSILRLIFTF